MFDRLGDLITLTRNVHRGKDEAPAEPPRRYPRPVTAIDRAKARAEARAEARIEDELDNLIEAAHATWSAEHRGEG